MATERVTAGAITSAIFRVKGQRSRWFYPDERLTPEYCEVLRNVNISERGAAHSRLGYGLYSATQLAGGEAVTLLKEVTFANGSIKRVVCTPSKVYTDTGTARVDVTGSALTGGSDDQMQAVLIKDQLVLNNSIDATRVWNGNDTVPNNTTNLATVPWTKTKGILLHKNLLMAWGTTEGGTLFPTRLRWCDINRRTFVVDINTWRGDNRYEVYDGGTAIIGAVDNWGLALIFKEDGLYPGEIFYDQLGLFDFRLAKPVLGFSPISKQSIVARPEFICGAAKEGIFIIRPDLSFSIVNTDDTEEWFRLNQNRLKNIQATIREKDHQVRFLVNSGNSTSGHDYILVWDWESGDTWIDLPKDNINHLSQVTDSNGNTLDWFGSLDGFLFQGNRSDFQTDNGTGFTWRIKMSPNDLGLPGKSKHVLNIRTLYRKRTGLQTITFKAHINEGRDGNVIKTLTTGSAKAWNDNLIWNTGLKWPGAGALRQDVFVNRICETVAPEWQSSDPASIEGYIVEFIQLEG